MFLSECKNKFTTMMDDEISAIMIRFVISYNIYLWMLQVYPNSWTVIYVSLDNQGMWNLRSAMWERQYLGQQFYLRVYNPVRSLANEYDIPSNALLCGRAVGRHS